LWFAVSPDNRIVVYKEVHEPDMIVSEAASKIIEINNNDVIQCTYAPSDLHARTKDGGKTIFDLFYQNGIRLTDTSNRREQGWLSVKEAIKITKSRDMETGKELLIPSLQIFSNCTHLIEYFPQIKRSQKNPNDCDTQPHEITHILDALRYFCVNMFAVHQSEEKQERYIDGSYLDEFETW
jgi:phage terminase large subunit